MGSQGSFCEAIARSSRMQPAWLERPCPPVAQVLLLVQLENTPAPTPRISRRHASSPGMSEGTSRPSLTAALKSLPGVGGRQQGRQVPLSAGWMLDVEACCFSLW